MKKIIILAIMAAMAVPAAAQEAPAEGAQAPGVADPADVRRGMLILRTFGNVLRAENVDNQVKRRLASCLYNNPVSRISLASGRVFANNPNLDQTRPAVVYNVAARVCGVQPQQRPAAEGASEGAGEGR